MCRSDYVHHPSPSRKHNHGNASRRTQRAPLNPGDVVLADKVAEEVAGYDRELETRRSDMELEFAGIRGEMTLATWKLGTVFPVVLAIALKLFFQ